MLQQQWSTPVLVVADDFTGANDAGSGFARAGARVNVLFDVATQAEQQQADVWAISTDSRAVSAEKAAERTCSAVDRWQDIARLGWIFKKIDSTLRGNPGAEIEAALLASGAPAALVVPAVPKLGRTTVAGQCLINGVLLTETEYASDPKTPVLHANISKRLAEQSGLVSGLISLHQVRQPDLCHALTSAIARGERFIVIDAESEEDLQRIMAAAAALPQRPLLAGAAGLSDALSLFLSGGSHARSTVAPTIRRAPVLAVIGSMSEISQRQIARLGSYHPFTVVDVDIRQLFTGWPDAGRWRQSALSALQRGQHCVIRTCQQPGQRQDITALCERYNLSRRQLGERICAFLADSTRELLQAFSPSALYLSGGDVAIAVAKGLGAEGFQIKGQVAGCVPYGHLLKVREDLLVLTKAGGFGDDTTLVDVFRFIEEKASE